ncbi:MAG TPA: type II toxin-antitoxin system Phd/YefM family antitoxin [Thermoanaerobaculia bacterium]|jgi:prevent-host-death family protein
MKRVPLSEVKDDLSRYVQLAAHEEIVVTRHGRPAAVLIGFEDEDDWFDYQLEHDPRFVARMEAARQSVEAGRGISIEEVREQLGLRADSDRRRGPSAKRARAPKRAKAKKRAR